MICFCNGRFLKEKEAMVPATDRGFLFGEGRFTTMRVQDGQIIWLADHLARLNSKRIDPSVLFQVIELNGATDGLYRMKVVVTDQTILVTLAPYKPPAGPLQVCIYPHPIEGPHTRTKSLSYLDRILAKNYAIEEGYDDAITIDASGNLLEGSSSNLFWRHEGVLYTPDPVLPLLKGIQLSKLLEKEPHQFVITDRIPEGSEIYLCNCLQTTEAYIERQTCNTA